MEYYCQGRGKAFLYLQTMFYIAGSREETFYILYNATKDSLYNYLQKYTRDTYLLDDIMQQCYLKVWERIEQIREPERAQPFIKKVAHHLLVDVVRRRMKEDIQWLETIQEEIKELILQPTDFHFTQLHALDNAIDRLPDQCREVYLLHREEGFSYKEIAAHLKVSVSMVEKHMSKAIRLLSKELLGDYSLILLLVATRGLMH